ncbi:hypothetical protein A6F68_01669 [Tsuneonella dongtanensis]|uniref:Uncharacterized protein n=1 Tax=Tsuneonella dongtanensis TaxID=692370 RepID=A0A1B2ADE7_9SPHN|nr:hypothetical protein A6F68_01669 [Tsuneonella dongtanensis]
MARKSTKTLKKNSGEGSGAVTDVGAKGVSKALAATTDAETDVPGPSENPATNLIIHDIAMRAAGRVVRHTMEKGLLRGRYGGSGAKAIIENRSIGQALVSSLIARLATRSLPGALLVGGGLVAKTLYDRGQSKRTAKRSGDKTLRKMAED